MRYEIVFSKKRLPISAAFEHTLVRRSAMPSSPRPIVGSKR